MPMFARRSCRKAGSLRRENFSIALVTSSARWMLTSLLDRMFGPNAFDTTISADDVAAHKPEPDCYLKALADLQPDRAVAFEDTVTGVSAAVAAQLPVIAVRHHLNAKHDLSRASAILPGLEETATVMETVHKMLSWR